ncbi:MAG: hypothetical protein M3179_10905 [Actinomycetota bacterium]|nr:hypothetical protein [Actinomycetota bacterium]
MFPSARDEGRHPPGAEPEWEESWQFDAVLPNASLGVSLRLALRGGRAWWWTSVAGARRDLVAVRDHDVDPPRGTALELRASGLWAELTCETPLDHWSAGLEAFGVALDDPAEAYGDERGQPMPVGLDLEWEALGACWPFSGSAGYGQPCAVHGEVLLGSERIAIDGPGARTHLWGVRRWWDQPWWQVHGRLDDGAAFWVSGSDDTSGGGAWYGPGTSEPVAVTAGLARAEGDGALLRRGTVTVGETRLDMTVAAHAPVVVPGPGGRISRFWRGLVGVEAEDGRRGAGWWERLSPGA